MIETVKSLQILINHDKPLDFSGTPFLHSNAFYIEPGHAFSCCSLACSVAFCSAAD